jgi:hypothetical protein
MRNNTLLVCEILDRLGSVDPFSVASPLEFKFSGPKTSDSAALENSLSNLVHRYQELELKVVEQTPEISAKTTIPEGRFPRNVTPQFTAFPLTPAPEPATPEPRVLSVEPTDSKSSSFIKLMSVDKNLVLESFVFGSPRTPMEHPRIDPSSDNSVIRVLLGSNCRYFCLGLPS